MNGLKSKGLLSRRRKKKQWRKRCRRKKVSKLVLSSSTLSRNSLTLTTRSFDDHSQEIRENCRGKANQSRETSKGKRSKGGSSS